MYFINFSSSPKIRLGPVENEAHAAQFFPVYADNNLPLIGQKVGAGPSFEDCVNATPSGELLLFSIWFCACDQ